MKESYATPEVEIHKNRAMIRQDWRAEEAVVGKALLWGAGGGFVTFSVLGNVAFACFWAVFLLGCWWFLTRGSGRVHALHFDKESGKLQVLSTKGKVTEETVYDLSSFVSIDLVVAKRSFKPPAQSLYRDYRKYQLRLYRPLDDAQIRQELPPQLSKNLGRSDMADALILSTARRAGAEYVDVNLQPLRDKDRLKDISAALGAFLAPEYILKETNSLSSDP